MLPEENGMNDYYEVWIHVQKHKKWMKQKELVFFPSHIATALKKATVMGFLQALGPKCTHSIFLEEERFILRKPKEGEWNLKKEDLYLFWPDEGSVTEGAVVAKLIWQNT